MFFDPLVAAKPVVTLRRGRLIAPREVPVQTGLALASDSSVIVGVFFRPPSEVGHARAHSACAVRIRAYC